MTATIVVAGSVLMAFLLSVIEGDNAQRICVWLIPIYLHTVLRIVFVTTDQPQDRTFVPGVIFTALLLVFKSLYRKIGDMLCSMCYSIFGDTICLKAIAQITYSYPWIFCPHFIFSHVYTACISDTIFYTKIYNAFIINLRDFRNPN